MMYERELRAAIATVESACRLCRAVRETLVTTETVAKRDKSPVTVADFGSQAVVAHALADAFPDDAMVAEEDAAELRAGDGALLARVTAHVCTIVAGLDARDVCACIDRGGAAGGSHGRFWVLDPIDGTKGFLRGEQYAVALALVEDGVPVLGVLGCPNLPVSGVDAPDDRGVIVSAVRGEGASQRTLGAVTGRTVRCSARAQIGASVLCESVESGHTAHGTSSSVAARLQLSAPSVRLDSQCKYAVVARGDADIYLRLPTRADYEEKVWDHAAGALIVTEAGGAVTDVMGAPLDFARGRTLSRNRGIVATNGLIHTAVLAAVRAEL